MSKEDVRLSGPTLKVLKMMLDAPRQARSGADISRAVGIGSGTLYPLLARLEQAAWFKSEWEDLNPKEAGRPRRRLYLLTPLGQRKANEALAELQMPEGSLAWKS
jgi:DNA-binding PadR family transcriptional regulator